MDPGDSLQQPWQERLLIFVILCAMVLYLARVLTQFRSQGLSVRRSLSDNDRSQGLSVRRTPSDYDSSASGEASEEYQEDHSE